MGFSRKKNFTFLFISLGIFSLSVCFVFVTKLQYLANKVSSKNFIYPSSIVSGIKGVFLQETAEPDPVKNIPEVLKAVYVTGWSAGSKNYQNYLFDLLKTTQVNAVVIDVKDSGGIVSYATNAPKAKEYKAYRGQIINIDALIKNLHDRGVYVIGRIVVFEDPILAKSRPDLAVYNTLKTKDPLKPVAWQDNRGLSWMDPASKEVLDYNIEIASDALNRGFDEINFDYMRFPTDGQESTMGYPIWDAKTPKYIIIKNVFQKLREAFPDKRLSVDIFGQTTTNADDMGIGQVFEDALAYFDYVSPMVYPSHYAPGFLGYKNPAEYPYEIITYAIDSAVARKKVLDAVKNQPSIPLVASAKIRPWLQDFNMGAVYGKDMVLQEIKAVSDAMGDDFNGYMLWNPSNVYTKEAIISDKILP